jgi:Mn-containing catalase
MILRIDRLQTELPPPSEPDPVGASAVQELLGGKYGEMSTFMNYTYQSFNFRSRQQARPFYDLVASIAAEEFGHIELVSAAINTMLTGAADGDPGELGDLSAIKGVRNTQHFIAGGAGALVQDSNGKPWNGDYVFSSGDLIEDLTHNFFLETGARNNKLKVYEMVEHPAARALTGYLLVRGGVHQVAYARAIERLTGADLMKLFPSPRIPTEKIPECQPHIQHGEHLRLYRFSPRGLPGDRGRLQRPASRDGRRAGHRRAGAAGGCAAVRSAAAAGGLRAWPGTGGDLGDRGEAPTSRGAPGEAHRRRRQRRQRRRRQDQRGVELAS